MRKYRPPDGRMPTDPTYNVLLLERVRVLKTDWDFFIGDGRWRALAAVYHHWSKRFTCCVGLVPSRHLDNFRFNWSTTLMSFLEKSRPRPALPDAAILAKCPWLAKTCPALHEFLTVAILPDGSFRQVSTLTLFVEDGQFKLCLSEKEHDCTLFASGECLESVLECLEERLTAPVVDWRRKGGKGNSRPGKSR